MTPLPQMDEHGRRPAKRMTPRRIAAAVSAAYRVRLAGGEATAEQLGASELSHEGWRRTWAILDAEQLTLVDVDARFQPGGGLFLQPDAIVRLRGVTDAAADRAHAETSARQRYASLERLRELGRPA